MITWLLSLPVDYRLSRARRLPTVDIAGAWQHRQFVKNAVIAQHGNRRTR